MPVNKQAAKKKSETKARIHHIMLDGRIQEDMTHYPVPVTPNTLTAYEIIDKYRTMSYQEKQEMKQG